MSSMVHRTAAEEDAALPTVPTEEAWRAMTPAARERLVVAINEALKAKAKAEQAEARALQHGLLAILDVRGIPCSEEALARIASCADSPVLRRWLLHAKTVGRVEELFSEAPPTA